MNSTTVHGETRRKAQATTPDAMPTTGQRQQRNALLRSDKITDGHLQR
jgi:hypothetical protein